MFFKKRNYSEFESQFLTSQDFFTAYVYPTTFDRDVALKTMPHYTDEHFRKEQTVFGRATPGLSYDYSDRLWQWDYEKAKQAAKIADASGFTVRSANYYECYLSAYFDKPIELKHIIAGVNHSNGYPYCIFGYKVKETTTKGEDSFSNLQ